ncbi:MAG: glycerophosphodiester phosphodiesterase family protein [Coriobacteriia bacterium]
MPKLLIVLAVAAVVLLAAFAFATGGKPNRDAPAWLTAQKIAHRGLWTDGPIAPENSLAAFEAAAEAGFAVELDVQLTGDGIPVVIHDDDLERMTGKPGLVSESPLEDLQERQLFGGDERIPTLAEALELIDGRVPVLVEIKNPGDVGALEDDVAEQLSAYEGEAAVMSFNPFSLARVAKAAPEVPRGQLASALVGEDLAWYEKLLLRNLLLNFTSTPDFIAYDIEELPSLATTLQRWRGRPLLGWTITDADELARAEAYADGFICDPGALE